MTWKKKEKKKIYVGLARDMYTCHVISTILNLVSLLGLVQNWTCGRCSFNILCVDVTYCRYSDMLFELTNGRSALQITHQQRNNVIQDLNTRTNKVALGYISSRIIYNFKLNNDDIYMITKKKLATSNYY